MSHYRVVPPDPGDLASVLEQIRASTSASTRPDVAISSLTSFRVGGIASFMIEPSSTDDLKLIGPLLARHDIPVLVVGRGSNILVSDSGFPGVVIKLGKAFDLIEGEGNGVLCGGASSFPQAANWAARRSLSGLEFAVAIPATTGGAVRMNAGAHGASVSDVLSSTKIVDLPTGEVRDVTPQEMRFEYRTSSVAWSQVVVSAQFDLAEGDRQNILEKMESYRAHRASTQPSEAPNAGSMFKNLPTGSAGSLVEECGLKGLRVGAAEVSAKHANFFLAHRGASAQDVFDLLVRVQSTVRKDLGKVLIPEVQIIGEFAGADQLVIE